MSTPLSNLIATRRQRRQASEAQAIDSAKLSRREKVKTDLRKEALRLVERRGRIHPELAERFVKLITESVFVVAAPVDFDTPENVYWMRLLIHDIIELDWGWSVDGGNNANN